MDETAASAPRWYVVQSQPHKELYAASRLEAQGYETFTPRLQRLIRHARRTRAVLRPLFPRYLFVRLDMGVDRWRSVRGTYGVSTMIMDGDRPRPAPVGVVEALRAAYDGAGGYDFSATLKPGDPVRFIGGAFADRLGRLLMLDEAGRVMVLLEILGAERAVSARVENLMPAAP